MCLQDVQLGRKTRAVTTQISVDDINLPVLGPNPDRVGIFISCFNTNAIRIMTGSESLPLNQYAFLSQFVSNLMLRIEEHGVIITGPWQLGCDAPAVISLTEFILDRSFNE